MKEQIYRATLSLIKREGTLLPSLKSIFFASAINKYASIKLREVLTEWRGGSWGDDYNQDYIPAKVLRSPDIRKGFVDIENSVQRYFSKSEIDNYNLVDNDILVIKSNGSFDLVGVSQIFKSNTNYPYVIASNFLMVLRPNTKIIHPEYLDLFLKSPIAISYRFNSQKTTTGLRNLKVDEYLETKIPLPTSIDEQKELVQKFTLMLQGNFTTSEIKLNMIYNFSKYKSELEKEFDKQSNSIQQLRQAFLREAMQGKLVLQDATDEPASVLLEHIKTEKQKLIADGKIKKEKPLPPIKPEEIPYEIPENWVWCRLGDIINSSEGGKSPNCINKSVINDEWGVIKTTAIQPLYFQESENKVLPRNFKVNPSHIITIEDVLITRAGPKNRVGIVCCVKNLTRKLILSDKTIRLNYSKALLNPYFLPIAINSPLIKPYLEKKMVGMAECQVNISQNNMKLIPLPLPPYSEQVRIVSKLDELMQYCNELEQNVKASKEQTEMLLQVVLKEALEGNLN